MAHCLPTLTVLLATDGTGYNFTLVPSVVSAKKDESILCGMNTTCR
jgi:hypothetical protein